MKGFGEQHKSIKKIASNKDTKLSKEQLIKQAFKLHSQGNISEAAKYYQYFIDQGLKDHRVFSNYGIILKDLGKLQEAEISQRKAIALKPGFANAHSNLGNILKDLGKLQAAELSQRKAIALKPDFANAHSNLGSILKDLGKLQEAEISFRKAIKIKPDFANAYSNLGNILKDLGKLEEAFDSYLKAIEINPRLANIFPSISRFLRDSDLSHLNKSKLKYILNLLLEKNNVVHKELFKAFNFLYNNEIINNLENLESGSSEIELFINDKLIIKALPKIIFSDPKWEELLTKLRATICAHIAKNTGKTNPSKLQFVIALAKQCFLNEYVYSFPEEENITVNRILNRSRDGEINETNIAILACYFPLYKLLDRVTSIKSVNSSIQSFQELIKIQISEPLKEIELLEDIKIIGSIKDLVSKKVKSQYEENPYPRWIHGGHLEVKTTSMQFINSEIAPNLINPNLEPNQLKILIAGCGTGNQIIQAQRYRNSNIIGIDLSSSSLSYAKRKINELGINNVELIQMDLLAIDLLEKKFDIILCSGVLHHLDKPIKGLKALLGVLKNNGFLKLGLYSELARQDIVQAREYIANQQLKPTKKNIRDFRQKILSNELKNLNFIKKFEDFYTLSECRDLCFHPQEHRFTIEQLRETLSSNELEFLGFILPQQIKSLYKNNFPNDTRQTKLQNWARFEENYPNTFRGMYEFWVSKTTI